MIVGVTDEGSGLIEKYIPAQGVTYPMVRASNTPYGVAAYPTIYFIGPDGKVLKNGIPSKGEIEEALRDVVMLPDLPKGGPFSSIRKDWGKRKFAAVLNRVESELQKPGIDAEQKAALDKLKVDLDAMESRADQSIAALAQGPDYGAADAKLARLENEWDGRDVAVKASEERARFKKDPAIKAEIKAGKTLAQLRTKYDTSKISQRKKLVDALKQFDKRFQDTYAAAKAAELAKSLTR